MDSLVMSKAIARPESPFPSVMRDVRADFARLTSHFQPLHNCKPFSQEAYNAISAIVLESLYTRIEEIDSLHDGIPYHCNLALILYTDLHAATCRHYFQEYERLRGFADIRPGPGRSVVRRREPLIYRAARKLSGVVLRSADKFRLRMASLVGWVGSTTFPWQSLASQLRTRGIRLVPVQANLRLSIPAFSRQTQIVELWAEDLHRKLAEAIGTQSKLLRIFGVDEVKRRIWRLCSMASVSDESYDLLVTGSLTLPGRALALQAQSRGIPVMTLHHGAHYLVFDEPFYALYEGALSDAKMVYGSIEIQRRLGTLGSMMNFAGCPIQFYSRTDPLVQLLYRVQDIEACPSLRGLTAVYIASEFESARYGPYRDVHPSTYLKWQERLLTWLEKQTGQRPLVRLHPKRLSTRYDPVGYGSLDGNMTDILNFADIFVIDYPTTSLAYVAATNKSVLFFDLGLRRLHPAAREIVRTRCHYASADLLLPDEAFAAMEADLVRDCRDDFTPTFSLGPDNKLEAASLADAICRVVDGSWCG